MKKIFALVAAACISTGLFAAETVYDLVPESWTPADGTTINCGGGHPLSFDASLGAGNVPIDGAHGTLTCAEHNYQQDVNIQMFSPMPGMNILIVTYEPLPEYDGTYILDMPQGQWGDADFIAGNGGHANAAFTYTYTLTGLGSPVSADCEITSYVPADGSTVAKFAAGDYFIINTSNNALVDYFTITWWDVTDGEDEEHRVYVRQGYGNHNFSEDPIIWEGSSIAMEFDQGRLYRGDVVLYATEYRGPSTPIAAEGMVYYQGGGEAYQYSPVKLLNIEPDPSLYVIESTNFTTTLVFDGWVEVNTAKSGYGAGQGSVHGLPEGCVSYNEAHTEVSVTWPESYLAECGPLARMFLYIYDQDGLIYNNGQDVKGDSNISLEYNAETDGCELFVTPEAGEVTELSSFSVNIGSRYGGEMNIAYIEQPATLSRIERDEVIYTFPIPEATKTSGEGYNIKNLEFTFILDTPITEPGRYALEIPYGYFNAGSEFTEAHSLRYVGIYTIEGAPVVGEVTYDLVPNLEGSFMTTDYEGLKAMFEWPVEEAVYNNNLTDPAYVTDADGNVVENNITSMFDWDRLDLFGYFLQQSLYTAGEQYTMYVPKGAFGDKAFEDANYTAGRACPAFEVLFTTERILAINVQGDEPKDDTVYDIANPAIEANVVDGQATITYTFEQGLNLYINHTHYDYPMLVSGFTLTADGEAVEADIEARAVGNRLIVNITPVSLYSDEEYVLTFDKGLFGDFDWYLGEYVTGHANEAIEFSFVPSSFKPALEYMMPTLIDISKQTLPVDAYYPDGDKVECIHVSLIFPEEVWYRKPFPLSKCVLRDPEGKRIDLDGNSDFYASGLNYYEYVCNMWGFDMESTGEFTLTIPTGVLGDRVWLDSNYEWGYTTEDIIIPFVPADYENLGVENVTADIDAANDVYNMQGVLILRDATPAQVKALPAGLYIVGGNKVAVK